MCVESCADCDAELADYGNIWASVDQGCFVCVNCVAVHRTLGFRTKSVNMDFWAVDEVARMTSMGNVKVWDIHAAVRRYPFWALVPQPCVMKRYQPNQADPVYVVVSFRSGPNPTQPVLPHPSPTPTKTQQRQHVVFRRWCVRVRASQNGWNPKLFLTQLRR